MEGDGNPQRDEVMISGGSWWVWGHCCSTNASCGPHKSLCQQKLKHCSSFSLVLFQFPDVEEQQQKDKIMKKCGFKANVYSWSSHLCAGPAWALSRLWDAHPRLEQHLPHWHTRNENTAQLQNEKNKKDNDSFTTFNMRGNKLAYWWQ